MSIERDWQAQLLEMIANPASTDSLPGLNPAGLAVYRNNYRVGLMETLALEYPVLQQIVGEEFFKGLTREYSKISPSLSGNLHLYGGDFGDFLDSFPPAQALPYLGDVARLEWAVHRSYYAADHLPLSATALAGVDPERFDELVFQLAPSCRVIISRWPIVAIWQGHQPGQTLQVDLQGGGEAARVSRHGGQVQIDAISTAEAALLAQLQQGSTLGEAAEAALASDDGFDLQTALLGLFSLGLLAGYSL